MKLMRLAMCVAVFAVIGGIAVSEDLDVRALQARLAAQEARLNDLNAKLNASRGGSEAEGVVSIRKNAVVTIGGRVNTRYFYNTGNVKSTYNNPNRGEMRKVLDRKSGDLKVSDAKLNVKIDVNEYFDAFLQMDLQHSQDRFNNTAGIAQNYWVRWKNVCNSGFGLLVGRNSIAFGDKIGTGQTSGYSGGGDFLDQMGVGSMTAIATPTGLVDFSPTYIVPGAFPSSAATGFYGDGMFVGNGGSLMPTHTGWDLQWRTTQINPYWEAQDGKIRFDLSLFQSIDRMTGNSNYIGNENRPGGSTGAGVDYVNARSINSGLGSGSFRALWKPIEGLQLTGSVMNRHQSNLRTSLDAGGRRMYWSNGYRGDKGAWATFDPNRISKNNWATEFDIFYRPACFSRLAVWGKWIHGWDEGWVKDLDTDTFNLGFSYDLTERFTFFAQGDYMRVKNGGSQAWNKARLWAAYAGLQYKLPYGVNMEIGYRHDEGKYKGINTDGTYGTHTKAKYDTIYGHLGFDF